MMFPVRNLQLFTAVLCFSALGLTSNSLEAQNAVEPDVVQIMAADGFPLKMSYYAARPDKNPNGVQNAPVVLFLHGEKGSRVQWDKGSAPRGKDPVPSYLNTQGYAVLCLDLRKHGDSLPPGDKPDNTVLPNDYGAMVAGDLVGVKKFLYDEHMKEKLNMSKLGIVACDVSVPVALAFADADWKQAPYDDSALPSERTPRGQDVRALVMISPKIKAGRITAAPSIQYLKAPQFGISMLFLAGEQDAASMRDLKTLYQSASAVPMSEERIIKFTPPTKDAGIPLLVKAPVAISETIKFLDDHLAKLDIPWRDRRSRLNR